MALLKMEDYYAVRYRAVPDVYLFKGSTVRTKYNLTQRDLDRHCRAGIVQDPDSPLHGAFIGRIKPTTAFTVECDHCTPAARPEPAPVGNIKAPKRVYGDLFVVDVDEG